MGERRAKGREGGRERECVSERASVKGGEGGRQGESGMAKFEFTCVHMHYYMVCHLNLYVFICITL